VTPSILIVIPTYNHFDYAARAVESALANTRTLKPRVLVVDDASPDRLGADFADPDGKGYAGFLYWVKYQKQVHGDDAISLADFSVNGGLTRSWNAGLAWAKRHGHDFCCVANSDLIFAPGWDDDVFTVLNREKYALVGPVTNAPGTNEHQYVGRYAVTYDPLKKDDKAHIAAVQNELRMSQRLRTKDTTLNGFCMAAFTHTWWANAYDADHVFRPRNDFNSKGSPTPRR
jgi:glycosyltransferase involved in cell wall biosynthesis